MKKLLTPLLALLVGCVANKGTDDLLDTSAADPDDPADPDRPGAPDCDRYPAGAMEPMALGEVLHPYRWPEARHLGTGQHAALDLGKVPCDTDEDIEWSPFDVLLFVSIPAW